MISRIEAATRSVEETLNNNDLQNKLLELSRTIESYDAIDADEFERVSSHTYTVSLTSAFFIILWVAFYIMLLYYFSKPLFLIILASQIAGKRRSSSFPSPPLPHPAYSPWLFVKFIIHSLIPEFPRNRCCSAYGIEAAGHLG